VKDDVPAQRWRVEEEEDAGEGHADLESMFKFKIGFSRNWQTKLMAGSRCGSAAE
jgi:hypothetical protein